jgi:hypothetical protein
MIITIGNEDVALAVDAAPMRTIHPGFGRRATVAVST